MKKHDVPKSDWELALEGKDLSRAKPYSMRKAFAPGDVIVHKNFGHGIVTNLQPENKIEILFQTGFKLFVHRQSK